MMFWSGKEINEEKKNSEDFNLFRTNNQSPTFRQYWQSKIQVDENNYDYSQYDSSWQMRLRDYSIQFSSIFDQLLSDIHDENQFLTQIRSIDTFESIFIIDYEALLVSYNSIEKKINWNFLDYEKMYAGNSSWMFSMDQ